MELGPGRPS